MRPLTEDETKTLFEKLAKYIGRNIAQLIERADGDAHVFRLHRDRVYYVPERVLRYATSVQREKLLGLGTLMGKFSKTGKFKLHITALDILAQHAMFKVWIKPSGEMNYLYGNHVLKAHLARITEDTPENQGVVIYAVNNDIPLGFGVTARSTLDCRKVDPTGVVVFHQTDVGEYLRGEETIL